MAKCLSPALHQGTSRFAADFIMVATDALERPEHHRLLLANGLAGSSNGIGAIERAVLTSSTSTYQDNTRQQHRA